VLRRVPPAGWVAFAVASALSLTSTLYLELDIQPDVQLYTSGPGLFPSPLGTAAGSVGNVGLAIPQALAAGCLAAGLVIARTPLKAVAALAPSVIWAAFLGVDLVAAVLVAAGVLFNRRPLFALAVGYHIAALPVVAVFVQRRWLLVGGGFAVVVLLATPYGAAASVSWHLPQALAIALLPAVLAIVPGALSGVPPRMLALPALGVLAAAAFTAQWNLQSDRIGNIYGQAFRYAMPVALIGLVYAYQRRISDPIVVTQDASSALKTAVFKP
jgi:hypothetical protein